MVYVFAAGGAAPDEARLGITVPRKVGGAVVRNRLKRQLREAMAALGPDAARGSDVIVLYEDPVIETKAMVGRSADAHGLLLQEA